MLYILFAQKGLLFITRVALMTLWLLELYRTLLYHFCVIICSRKITSVKAQRTIRSNILNKKIKTFYSLTRF